MNWKNSLFLYFIPLINILVKTHLLIIVDTKKVKIYLSVFSFFFFLVLCRLSFLLLSRLEDAAHEGPLQQAGFQGSLLEWALEKKKKEEKKKKKKKMR